MIVSLLSTAMSLKMASTEIGSVAATIAPKTNAMRTGIPSAQCSAKPEIRVAANTPTVASKADRNKTFSQVPELNLQTALEQKGRQKNDQTDIGC